MVDPTLDEALARIPSKRTPADRRVMVERAREERALWETREQRAEAKREATEAGKKARAEEREAKKVERERVAVEKKALREAKKQVGS